MQKKIVRFSTPVEYYFDSSFSKLKAIADPKNSIVITDENVFHHHEKKFRNWETIVLKPGEQYKVQQTVDTVIAQLIGRGAGRNTLLIGVGGGVITDLTGYVASVFLRGIPFGFVPATLLSMVDAAVGGKNGIDVGDYKNMVGAIRQPSFIFYDLAFLDSLPVQEWRNGFTEIIKHALIKDAPMFRQLRQNNIETYQKNKKLLAALVRRNVMLKSRIVQKDEFDTGLRRILNFGHTLGHALERQYALSHGESVSIGMAYAARLSHSRKGFKDEKKVLGLLSQYGLPVHAQFQKENVLDAMKKDKKKKGNTVNFILLEKIGKAAVVPIGLDEIYFI